MDKKYEINKVNINEEKIDIDVIYDFILKYLNEFININEIIIKEDEINLNNIFFYINNGPFKSEECKICNLDDYDDIIKYYSIILQNFGYYFSEAIFQISEIWIRIFLIDPLIKNILKIIKNNKLNLKNELIKFYISHIFDFYSNKDIDSLSHDISLYTTALHILKTNFNINEFDDVNYDLLIKYSNNNIYFENSIKDINTKITKIMKNIIKYNKNQINLDIYNNAYNNLFNNKFLYDFYDKYYYDFLTQNNLIENLKLIKPFINEYQYSKYFYKSLNKLLELSKDIKYKNALIIYFLISNIKCKKILDFINEMIYCLTLYKNYLNGFDKNKYFHNLFNKFITNNEFKNFYYKVIKSKKIKIFIEKKKFDYDNLENNYNEFINNFINSNKFFNYVKLMTLSYYKKAYTDNYLRIFINDNFIKIQGNLNENEIEDIAFSYLIITLLHESFHFINRFNKTGKPTKSDFSPISKETNEKEIGIDLIYFIFNVKTIKELDVQNANFIKNLNNWENENFSFHSLNLKDNNDDTELKKGLKFINLKNNNKNKKKNLFCYIKRYDYNY